MEKRSNEIFYSKGKNDECYTPRNGVLPLLEFVKPFKDKIIWCPFDTEDSEFVKVLRENGYMVIYSHISEGKNFFDYEPPLWHVMISNPPFTDKRKIFERAKSFGKPFALLMSIVWLNDSAPKEIFGDDMQLLMFDKRMRFIKPNGETMGSPTFSSAYFCYNFLPQQIICRSINNGDK